MYNVSQSVENRDWNRYQTTNDNIQYGSLQRAMTKTPTVL